MATVELTPIESDDKRPGVNWQRAALLLALSFLGSVLVLPFTYALLKQSHMPGMSSELLPVIMVINLIIEFGFSIVAVGLGLWLGPKVGLATPLLKADGDGTEKGLWAYRTSLGLAIGLGLGVGVLFTAASMAIEPMLPEPPESLALPSPWAGLLGSIGAGIREEVWLRLGFMTLLVWLGATALRQRPPGAVVVWIANLLAALAFGAMHLPQAFGLIGSSTAMIVFVLAGNGVPGLVFGWLYWRRGLFAAMVAHLSLDLVLKVIVPLLHLG
jgi:hypothetical protein